MSIMRIGFSKSNITPPPGIVLGGYAGYRPCSGVHDPLYCKTVVLEQEGLRYCLISMDFLNGAAGNISTRFTRQESSFNECVRMGQIAAKHILAALGELPFTQPEELSIIAYTNGYFRYICPEEAYAANHYEAMAAIVNRGSGEHLMQEIQQLRRQLQDKH